MEHALSLEAEYSALNNKKNKTAVKDCDDFLTELDDQTVLVQQLFQAIVDDNNIIDKAVQKGSRKRTHTELEALEDEPITVDNTQVTRVKTAPNVVLEIIAWKLLVSASSSVMTHGRRLIRSTSMQLKTHRADSLDLPRGMGMSPCTQSTNPSMTGLTRSWKLSK
jgi:hypothetical protein